MQEKTITSLYKSKQTVFRPADLSLLWNIQNKDYLKTKINRLIKRGVLISIRPGMYALNSDQSTYSNEGYNIFELANKLVVPSYVSLYTILAQAGVIFQYDAIVYSVARISTHCTIQDKQFIYHKIRDDIFFQQDGIQQLGAIAQATLERAVLDTLYLNKDAVFDNINPVNVQRCEELLPLYNNKQLNQRFYHQFI